MAENSKEDKENKIINNIRKGKVNTRELITTFPKSHICPTDEEE